MPESEGEMLTFAVTIPKDTLADLALNMEGIEGLEGLDRAYLAQLFKNVVMAGLEEYLGEADDIMVRPV